MTSNFCPFRYVDALKFHTTINEAYNVVDPTARVTEAMYETVTVARNVPPSASQPTTTTTASEYETI